MLQYCIKRIILMIPTFFVVSIVIFLILNLAPGRPGETNDQGVSTTSESANARESYRIFKEQFNLDKPIFFNTRFSIEPSYVTALLVSVVLYERPETPASLRPPIAEVIAAQDELEDLGQIIVPHLYSTASKHPDADVRWRAVQRLSVNARRPLLGEFSQERLDEKTRALNQDIDQENSMISSWSWTRKATPDEERAVMRKWDAWMASHKDRFTYGFGDKVSMFLFDTRFAKYWSNLVRLDLGVSHIDRKPVFSKILDKLTYSLTLSGLSIFLIYIIAVPLGVFSAVRQNTATDQAITVVLFMLYSLPSFFTGVLLLQLFATGPDAALFPPELPAPHNVPSTTLLTARAFLIASSLAATAYFLRVWVKHPERRTPAQATVHIGALLVIFVVLSILVQTALFGSIDLFPAGGFDSANASRDLTTLEHIVNIGHHLILPVFCLTYGGLASLSRYARSGLLDIIRSDYIRTARAKGLPESVVVIKHATRNGMIPVLTLLGSFLPLLVGGSVIIEIIFNIPGMGLFLYEAIQAKDYNVVMGVLLMSSVLTLIGLLLSDLSYAFVDPRISFD